MKQTRILWWLLFCAMAVPHISGMAITFHQSKESCNILSSKELHQLRQVLLEATKDYRATVGICVMTEDKVLVINDPVRYPLMSVFKLHVAATVFREMERRGDSLASVYHITASDLRSDTYSPLRDSLPQGGRLPLRVLLRHMLALSDNNTCDWLIDYVGGIEKVQAYLHDTLHLQDFCLKENERTMHADEMRCYNNWASPYSVAALLQLLLDGNVLEEEHRLFLLHALVSSPTGADKLRAGLPASVSLAHKTGHSPRINGMRIADCDAGCFLLPDGKPCYLVVLVRDSYEDDATNAAIFSNVAEIVYHSLAEMP